MILKDWSAEKPNICKMISERKSSLKIVLKTKDDPLFLRGWIDHHSKIVGHENLIIIDNASRDEAVAEIYSEFSDKSIIVSYNGNHNHVHDVSAFRPLYDSLQYSCEYFCVLDTDERLVLMDVDRYRSDQCVVDYIAKQMKYGAIPCTWAHNALWSDSLFYCGTTMDCLLDGLTWGKPIINSRASISGFINHNCQIGLSAFGDEIAKGLFILHMPQLSPSQRIRTNLNKLKARSFATDHDDAISIISRDTSCETDGNIGLYVEEIRRLLPLANEGFVMPEVHEGCFCILQDGLVDYYSSIEREVMSAYLLSSDEKDRKALNILG